MPGEREGDRERGRGRGRGGERGREREGEGERERGRGGERWIKMTCFLLPNSFSVLILTCLEPRRF